MNKDNAKDYLPFVQALAEGKTIQHYYINEWITIIDPCFSDEAKNYRIKPEVEYVPFDTVEELINCWCQKRFDGYKPYNTELEMPLIWVKNKFSGASCLITAFDKHSVRIDINFIDLETLFNGCTFLDGSPIGKIKE